MKRHIQFFFLLIFLGQFSNIHAQTAFETKIKNTFAKIRSQCEPDVLIYDAALPIINPSRFNGQLQEDFNADSLNILVNQINQMAGKNLIPDKWLERVQQFYNPNSSGKPIKLTGFLLNYKRFKPDALSSGKILYQQEQFVPVQLNSALLEDTLFVIAPLHLDNSVSNFELDSNLFITNFGTLPDSVKIQIGLNGVWQDIAWNQPFQISMGSLQSLKIGIEVKLNQQKLKSFFSLNRTGGLPSYVSQVPIQATIPYGTTQTISHYQNISFQINSKTYWVKIPVYQEVPDYNRGFANILFGYDFGQTTRRNKIKKPLIFIEGIDFGYPNEWEGCSNGKCGSNGLIDLINGKNIHKFVPFKNGGGQINSSMDAELAYGPQMLQRLNQEGYDLIYLDFEQGADHIQRNAFVLVELIQWINRNKIGNEEIKLVGASMGGLVMRYALTYMEKNNIPHCSEVACWFDSPNQGANIPISLQYMIHYTSENNHFNLFSSSVDAKERKLNRPAARQLLSHFYQYYGGPDPLRGQYLQELNNLGDYPKNTKKVAIANGSGIGVNQGFQAGNDLFHLNLNLGQLATLGIGTPSSWSSTWLGAATTFYDCDMYASCGNGNGLLFYGNTIMPNDEIFRYTNSNCQIQDNLPGGKSDAAGSGNILPLFNLSSAPNPITCFVPTSSALDLGNPTGNPFTSTYAPIQNEWHVMINSGNVNFLVQELQTVDKPKQAGFLAGTASTFHFGQNTAHRCGSLNLSSGHSLKINTFGNTAFGGGAPVNTGTTFKVDLGGCTNETLEISTGATLEMGSLAMQNSGELIVKAGSIIRLKGLIKLENNSRLVIEKQAKLIIQNGAKLILQDPSSNLIIEGDLEIESGGIFQPTGLGKLIFNQGENNLILGQNAQFILEGTSKQHNRMILEDGSFLRFPVSFGSVRIENCAIKYSENARISALCSLKLNNTSHQSLQIGQKHHGLKLWGQASIEIKNSEWNSAWVGIESFSQFLGNSLKIENCSFSFCDIGIKTHDKAAEFTQCQFMNNNTGWFANAMGQNSKIYQCTFIANEIGANLTSQSGVNFLFRDCQFTSNTLMGIHATSTDILVENCQLRLNQPLAINLSDANMRMECSAAIQNDRVFNLDGKSKISLNENAKNAIRFNQVLFTIDNPIFPGMSINLENGQNDLRSNLHFAEGIIPESMAQQMGIVPFNLPHRTGLIQYFKLEIPNNLGSFPKTTTTNGSPLGSLIQYFSPFQFVDANGQNQGIVTETTGSFTFSACGNQLSQGLETDQYSVFSTNSQRPIAMPDGSVKEYLEAIRDAINTLSNDSQAGNDTSGIRLLSYLNRYTIQNPTESEKEAKELAYQYLKSALTKAYNNGQLLPVRATNNSNNNEFINLFKEVVNEKIQSGQGSADKAQWRLDLASAYRLGEYYSQALSQIDLISPTEKASQPYWKCICSAEKDLAAGNLTEEDFPEALLACHLTFSQIRKAKPVSHLNLNSLSSSQSPTWVYPNPIQNKTVEISLPLEMAGTATLTVLDAQGKIVEKWSADENGLHQHPLNLLNAGVYFLQVQLPDGSTHKEKIIIP